MKYRMKSEIVDAVRYQPGMEDGWIIDRIFYPKDKPVPRAIDRKAAILEPKGRFGVQPVTEHDYIVTHSDGAREVMSRNEFDRHYEPAGEPQ